MVRIYLYILSSFSFSKVIINIKSFEIYVEQNLFFVHYLLNEKQKAYICDMHVCISQLFERERVYIRNKLFNKSIHLCAVNLHNWRPSSISAPKISHVAKNGQRLGVNKKGNHTTHTGSFESK